MKKIFLLFVAVATLSVGSASAQGWLDALKGAATTVVDKVTGGQATQIMLPGTWSYNAPAMRLTSEDNLLADVASSALVSGIEDKLVKAYSFIGIKQGSCTFTFNTDNTFTALMGKHNLSGTYSYTADTHLIELNFTSSLLKLTPMKGYAYIDGSSLELVFDCSKLMTFLTKLGSKVSILNGITSLAKNYDGMMLGFGFTRNK